MGPEILLQCAALSSPAVRRSGKGMHCTLCCYGFPSPLLRSGRDDTRSLNSRDTSTRDVPPKTCHIPPMIDHPTRDVGFGVYVHWPFCASKCPYCDFNSHVRHQPVDQERFALAFDTELETMRARTGPREVTSIFLGGG